MHPNTEEPLTLAQLAGQRPRRHAGLIVGIVLAAVLIVGGVVTGVLLLRDDAPSQPAASSATPVVNGISRPDATCVTTDGTDHQDYWNGNGWWAGRIDGEAKEMPALAVLSLKLKGHQINSVWICAPRSNG